MRKNYFSAFALQIFAIIILLSVSTGLKAAPGIVVKTPNGAEIIAAGTIYNITWTGGALTLPTKIEYSADSGVTWIEITASASSSTYTYAWTVPTINSVNCLVAISQSSGANTDTSNAVFTITTSQSIGEKSAISNYLNLYPNPSSENMSIATALSAEEIKSISIYSVTGQLVKAVTIPETIGESISVSLAKFTAGAYFVAIETKEGQLIKEKFEVLK